MADGDISLIGGSMFREFGGVPRPIAPGEALPFLSTSDLDPGVAALVGNPASDTAVAVDDKIAAKVAPLAVSVMDYGATGDGTTDDTAAIHAAIAAVASGGVVHFPVPSVRYKVTRIDLNVVGVNLVGASRDVTIRGTVTDGEVLAVTASNTSVSRLTFDGNNVARGVIDVFSVSDVRLSDITVINAKQISSGTGLPAGDGTPARGIRLRGNLLNVVVENFTIDGVDGAVDGYGRGIWVVKSTGTLPAKGVVIQKGTISNVGPVTDGDGIAVQNWAEGDLNDIRIDNVAFFQCLKRAVKAQSPGVHVTNCFVDRTYDGTSAYSVVSIYFSNCSVTGMRGTSATATVLFDIGDGITVKTLSNVSIQNCIVSMDLANITSSCDVFAVRPVGSYSDITIANNQTAGGRYGFRLQAVAMTGLTLMGNTFDALTSSPIMLAHTGLFKASAMVSNICMNTSPRYFVESDGGAGTFENVVASLNRGATSFQFEHSSLIGKVAFWGNQGNSAYDRPLTRTDYNRATATDPVVRVQVAADTQPRLEVRADGTLLFGSGAAGGDASLTRVAAGVLGTGLSHAFRTGRNVTASRPSASTVGAGAQFYDTTLNKPIWSDGTNWKDAAGTTV
jgi:hypothetical protein